MRRVRSAPREDWARLVESQGLPFHRLAHPADASRPYWDESVHYAFTLAEVEALEEQVEELHRISLAAVEHVIAYDRFDEFAIPAWAAPEIARSWARRDPHVYGRFDLRYDGSGPAKLLEYNADTPTSLLESSVVQWFWKQDTHPADDQWNSLHERLIARWGELLLPTGPTHFTWTNRDETGEEAMTLAYLQDTAAQAGLRTIDIAIEEIGWDPATERFTDLAGRVIRSVFKLYPWEWMLADDFGPHAVRQAASTTWIEPLWKTLLSNKALLAILWELYPGHPNLLPAYLDGPRDLPAHVAKPLLGREGAAIRVVTPGGELRTPGPYGAEGHVYQAFAPLPEFEGERPVLGAWVVADAAAGLGIRESRGPVTDDAASFVPHLIERP